MAYCKIVNNAVDTYPYTLKMLKSDNPNVSFPKELNQSILNEFGVHYVEPTAMPVYDANTHTIVEETPDWNGSTASRVWNVVALTQADIDQMTQSQMESDDFDSVNDDTFVQNFIAMRPTQVSNYVETNVTDLASAKDLLEKLSLMVLYLAKKEFK